MNTLETTGFVESDQDLPSTGEWIERQILAGRLPPGARVELPELLERNGLPPTELNEAVVRLSLNGLASPAGEHALRVAPVSVVDLEDLTATRIIVEGAALRAAIAAGDHAWEERVRAAYARLAELDPLLAEGQSGGAREGWEAANHDFHDALTDACPARRLLRFAALLYLQHERYRRLSIARPQTTRDVASEHRALFDAAMARDADRACAHLTDHIQRTATIAAEGIRDGSWFGNTGDYSRPLR